MFKVFLGSTFKDLHEHRAAVLDAIIRLGCAPVAMEWFGARAGTPKDECLKAVGDCDLYVGLIGHCYGHVPDGEAVSITEAEYEAAVAKELPRLLFVASDDFLMPASIQESEVQRQKQQEFRKRVLASGTTQWFGNDKGTLAARVGEALSREAAKHSLSRSPEPATAPVFLPRKGLCVGREAEVARVCAAVLAEEPEPVVVLGPPGIGKSKVTIAALHDSAVKARFGERRWFVRLETAPEPAAILGQVALAIGVRPGPDLDARVLSALAAGPGLLVLDNTETPWWRDAAGTEAVLEALSQVPELALVCSVRGQKAPHRPDWGATILVRALDEPAARELFLRRAGERHVASALLSGLLADMDGVPLAIELLAAQVRADEQGLERVTDAWRVKRTELLASRPGAGHRLDSYEVSLALSLASPRMTGAARRLYAMMGRLPAGLRSEWAEILLPGEGEAAAEVLGELGLAFDAGGRLRMLAPVREHAADEELTEPWKDRLIKHWLGLALEHGPKVGGPEGAEAAALLGREWANLERACDLALAEAPTRAIDAAAALTKLVWMAGLGSSRMLLNAEAASRALGDDWRTAHANECLGDLALARSDHEGARQRHEQALPLYRQVGDVLGEAVCIARLAEVAMGRSDHEAARRGYEAAMLRFRQVGDVLGEANCIWSLGDLALARSDHEGARQRYEQALPLYRQVGSVLGEAACIARLAEIAMGRSDYGAARRGYEAAMPRFRQVGDVLGEASCIYSLGDIALQRSDQEGARQRYEEALPLYRQVGSVLGEANCIRGLGYIALAGGDTRLAYERFGEALTLYRRIEEPYSIGWALVRLARLADGVIRAERVAEARAAWESIDRADLVADLEREFGVGRKG